jgi:glycosyltransferase involved in cell wall biosynthesis
MIFVDDCGTDDSMDKVRAAAAEEPRIRIIENKENIGAGPSRNRGIDAARGEYLSFVDSDDCVATVFLELLYQEAIKQSHDIVKGSVVQKNEYETFEITRKTNRLIRNGLAEGKPLYTLFKGEHSSAIYRREFLNRNNIRYGKSSHGEDTTFLLRACSQADSFSLVDEACYFYYRRANSATSTRDSTYAIGQLQSLTDKINFVISKLPDDKYSRDYLSSRFHFALFEGMRFIDEPDTKEVITQYSNDLRNEFLRLPYHEDLASEDFSLYALQKYCCLLPRRTLTLKYGSYDDLIRYAMVVEKWVDFFLTHPDDVEACWRNLKTLIIRANNIAEQDTSSLDNRNQGLKYINRQVKRLSLKYKVQLVLPKVKAVLKRIKRKLQL